MNILRFGIEWKHFIIIFGERGRESKKNHDDPIEFISWLNTTCKKNGSESTSAAAAMKMYGQGRVIDSFSLSSSLDGGEKGHKDNLSLDCPGNLNLLSHNLNQKCITINYE